MTGRLEHVNLTVSDPDAFAHAIGPLFGWKIRWSGQTQTGKRAVHVGSSDSYVALFAPERTDAVPSSRYALLGGLNHLGVVVDDLDETCARIEAAGYALRRVEDYEPGRRAYFDGPDGVEIEVISYA